MGNIKDDIRDAKKRLEKQKAEQKYDKAADSAINVAELYRGENEYGEAYNYYEEAKSCISEVATKNDAVLFNEFLAYRGCLEMTCHESEEEIKEALNVFLEYVQRLKDPSYKQIALHVASYIYQTHLKGQEDYLEKAKSYSLRSLKMLEERGEKIDEILKKRYKTKKEFEEDDSRRRIAGTYQLLASISDEDGDSQAAEDYINKALKFVRLETDAALHHTILSTKRNYVARVRQYEISSKMMKLLENSDKKYRAKNLIKTQSLLAADCLSQKNLVEAGKIYWQICSNKKSGDRELKKEAKGQLIKLYKVNERLKEVKQFEEVQPHDYRILAKMYEKIADEMLSMCVYELAIDYYMKMKDAAALITPGDPEYGDLTIARGAMISLAETYNDILDFEEAIRYYEKLQTIEIRSNFAPAALAENRLNIAISKSNGRRYTYEEQKDAFEKVKMPKTKTVLYVKYLEFYIEFLQKHKNKEGVSLWLNDLNIELEKHQQILTDSQDIVEEPIKSTQDKYDVMSDAEIFQNVKRFYKFLEDIEEKKKKINDKSLTGENILHEAARGTLNEVKILIKRCGYRSVINAKDYASWTPLFNAVFYEHADIVEYLIENGADINTYSEVEYMGANDETFVVKHETPMMQACSSLDFEIICILIGNGANPCLMNENNWTAGDYLEKFIRERQLDSEELEKFTYVLKILRPMEEKGGIKNRKKKLNISNEFSKKPVPKLQKLKRQQGGLAMFQDALARLGRKPSIRIFAKPRESKPDKDDKMFEDDDFIAPESDEDAEMNDEKDSDDAMDVDDDNFRQINGFSSSTRSSATKANPQQKLKRKSSRAEQIESDDEEVMVLFERKNDAPRRRKREPDTLKRQNSIVSLESSSSSKKTKRSTSTSERTGISDNMTITGLVDSFSLSQPPRINVDAKELDLSFSENVGKVSTNLKLHLNLFKLCLKGSDFDDDINELIDAICACHKLVELDLSQVEQIDSSHANRILKKCSKLKVLDIYGTSVKVINLQSTYVLEKLIIAKTPFEYSDVFFEQINALSTLSYLDVSHTDIDLPELLSKLSENRTKLHIKASPISAHCDLHRLSRIFSNLNSEHNITLKLSRSMKEDLLVINSSLHQFLKD